MTWALAAVGASLVAFFLSVMDPVVGPSLRVRAARSLPWIALCLVGVLRGLFGPVEEEMVFRGATLVVCFAIVATGFRPGLLLPRVNSALSSTPRKLRVRGVVVTWLMAALVVGYSILSITTS